MHFLIKLRIVKKYNYIWNKDGNSIKKEFDSRLLKIKEILKTRMKLCERKITTDLPKKNT